MTKKRSFILHDETINTYGFRMLTAGADLTEFKKNPVMLFNHDDWGLPIGRWENIRKENGKILADPVFDLKDERGKQVAQKIEDEFLRAASIGSWPPQEFSDMPDQMLPGQKRPTVTKWMVREASITTIGANHNALVFYDSHGDKLEMKDAIKLFDNHKPKSDNMSQLNKILKLADNASESDRVAAIQALIDSNVELTDQTTELTTQLDEFKQREATIRTAKAIALTDAAIKDGRINANAKEQFIKLFDADFDNAESILSNLPKRKSVAGQIEQKQEKTELSDMQKASWDELDKLGKLIALKDQYPDLYAEKYESKFGVKPGK